MTSPFSILRSPLCLAACAAVSGCGISLGEPGDVWSYCAEDGLYVCTAGTCEWVAAECPVEPGAACAVDDDCATGDYCGSGGMCEQGGFCNDDSHCAPGTICDVLRQTCLPDMTVAATAF